MEDLYQICRKYFNLLLKNQYNLSENMQISTTRDRNYLKNTLKEIQLCLSCGKIYLSSLIYFCKIGDVLNMDILSELLINIKKDNFDYCEEQNIIEKRISDLSISKVEKVIVKRYD